MLLAVNLVVRDEAAHLAECLASVREIADEVVVHDTGSSDATVAIARAAGARVFEGQWRDDFAEARNVALAASTATWVLSLDADERWRGDPAALRTALLAAAPAAAFTVAVTNIAPAELGGDYEHRAPRLFRRAGTRWQGRVHEEPAGAQVRLVPLPPEAGSLLHLGYSDPAVHAGKSARNAAIAQAELDSLLAGGAARPAPGGRRPARPRTEPARVGTPPREVRTPRTCWRSWTAGRVRTGGRRRPRRRLGAPLAPVTRPAP